LILRALTASASLLVLCGVATAQQLPGLNIGTASPTAAGPATAPNENDLKAKLAAAQAELDRFTADTASRAPQGVPQEELAEYRTLLGLIAGSYGRQLDARDELALVQRNRAALAAKIKNWSGLGPGPYPLSLTDGLRESAQTTAQKVTAAEARLELFTGQIESTRARLKDAEAALRLAEERAASTKSEPDSPRQVWARDLAAVRARALGAALAALDARTEIVRTELAEYREELAFTQRQIDAASKSTSFSRADLNQAVARIDKDKAALDRELAEAQGRLVARRDALKKAQADLAAELNAPWRPGESPDEGLQRRVRLERAAELARVQAENANVAYDVIRGISDATTTERAIWQYRFDLANDKDGVTARKSYERVGFLLKRLQPWKQFAERETTLARAQISEQQARAADSLLLDDRTAARNLVDAYQERLAIYERVLRAIERQEAMLVRWKADFDDGRHERPLWSYAHDAWFAARQLAGQVWDFELFTADDTLEVDGRKITATRSVTVGKSVGAIVLLILGYILVSWIVKRLERQLVARFKADPNVARIARRWVQVILVAVLFVLALDLVKIPLTVFAFLGGALAIAFGFGAQNLLKNLISGIMLLVERPLKIGDLVQIGDILGTVTNISIRSSTIRTGDGIETLVPNSALVENNVTNWTYSSSQVRRSIKVGVAYGSDTREVADTLLAQADRHGQVLKQPAPRVIFEDFGADALVFALEYWIDYGRGADGRQIASDLRFMTEKALAEAGIAVPLPQRDVHLAAAGPLRVEVVSRAEPQILPRQSRG